MTKYDILHEYILEKYNNHEITLEQANELNNIAFEKYADVDYYDDEMGAPFSTDGYSSSYEDNLGSEMDPDEDWDLDTDYYDDEIGAPYSTDGYASNYHPNTRFATDPSVKNDLMTRYYDDEMGNNISESIDEIQGYLDEYYPEYAEYDDVDALATKIVEAVEDGVLDPYDAREYLSVLQEAAEQAQAKPAFDLNGFLAQHPIGKIQNDSSSMNKINQLSQQMAIANKAGNYEKCKALAAQYSKVYNRALKKSLNSGNIQ